MPKQRYFIFRPRAWFIAAMFAFAGLFAWGLTPALAMDSQRGGALPQPLPLLPGDNWWNSDISSWPVDGNSAQYIAFINNGGTRRLHPDFGGKSGVGFGIYGIPYVAATNITNTDLQTVHFQYWDESDGVDLQTGQSYPFYPIPPEAISEPDWIEGGDPGNIDLRNSQDRHLLIVDKDRNHLFELYNVFYDAAQGQWYAGSGAFFDMNTNNRRPEGWTSADAAGLAILPGLVRYDEVYDPNVSEIRHALRVTVRATNGYVFPASHRAGSKVGALPMGARLRLKASVDVTQRTSDPNMQKIFRAMQRYGLIVADNGSDMFVTGTHDTRWNNDILNPAFRMLTASDFEVIQLGYNPSPSAVVLASITLSSGTVVGGQQVIGTIMLSAPAPTGGLVVNLSSANPAASLPATVVVPGNATSVAFTISTTTVASPTIGNITARYNGVSKSAVLTVNPAAATLAGLSLSPTRVKSGGTAIGTVVLSGGAPSGGIVVDLSTSNTAVTSLPGVVTIPAGATSAKFTVATSRTRRTTAVVISAAYNGVTQQATLKIRR